METTQQVQDTGLKRFNERLRDLFLPGIKLTPQEETIMNIIYKILGAPGTVKITPTGGAYYLINADLHYYVRVGAGNITIVNSVDSIVRHCPLQVSDFAQKAIDRSIVVDVDLIEKTIFHNEMDILKKIEDKLPKNGETTPTS